MADHPIDSIEDLLSLALDAERKAAKRYAALAEGMRANGNDELDTLFSRIAGEEREHATEIERLITKLGIENLPPPPEVAWRHPQVRDNRDLATNPNLSTPYLALAYAVNNEEQAFRFYSYVAANTNNEQVRQFAEVFAKEELTHAALFREQRRRAYHAQVPDAEQKMIPDPGEIHSAAELVAASVYIEQGIYDDLLAAETTGLDVADDVGQSLVLIEGLKQDLAGGKPLPKNTVAPGPGSEASESTASDKLEAARRLVVAAERAFLFYDNVTDATPDEATMLRAQELTALAVQRIDRLQKLLSM